MLPGGSMPRERMGDSTLAMGIRNMQWEGTSIIKILRIKSYLYFPSYLRYMLIRSLKIMFLSFIMRISKFPAGLCHNLTSIICLVCTAEKDRANSEGKHIVSEDRGLFVHYL